jgi:hypothetical protein
VAKPQIITAFSGGFCSAVQTFGNLVVGRQQSFPGRFESKRPKKLAATNIRLPQPLIALVIF